MTTRTLISAVEFEASCGQYGPCELVRGEVLTLSPGGYGHSRFTFRIAYLLGRWVDESQLGRVLTNEAGLITETDPDTVRGADVAYFSFGRLPRGAEPQGFIAVPPNLVVEVVGKGQGWREMVEKAGEYLRMGVDRVWVVDPESRRVHVFRADAEPVILSEADRLADAGVLPGFGCSVSELFQD